MQKGSFSKKIIALTAIITLLLAVILFQVFGGSKAVNPASNTLDDNPRAGLDYALIYNQGELFQQIDSDDQNLMLIQEDLGLFAKTTIPLFADESKLIGFTFDEKSKIEGDTAIYTGYYYGVEDKIELKVTNHNNGVVTLSITNLENNTNIDESLELNGPKNRLLVSLPVESDFYSVRYFKSENKVVAGFYRGYTNADVDKVVKILTDAYGEEFDPSSIVFNINAVGIFDLEGVRRYSTDPENVL